MIFDKPIMVCDVDDVLSTFNEHWITIYNNLAEDNITINDIKDWDITLPLKPEWKDRLFTDEIIYSKNLYKNVPLKEYANEFVEWADKHYHLLMVSSPLYNTQFDNKSIMDKSEWIMTNFPKYDIRKFIPLHFKQYLQAHVRIDDRPKNLLGNAVTKILMDRPWNFNGCNEQKNLDKIQYIRLNNLKEAKNYLTHLL